MKRKIFLVLFLILCVQVFLNSQTTQDESQTKSSTQSLINTKTGPEKFLSLSEVEKLIDDLVNELKEEKNKALNDQMEFMLVEINKTEIKVKNETTKACIITGLIVGISFFIAGLFF